MSKGIIECFLPTGDKGVAFWIADIMTMGHALLRYLQQLYPFMVALTRLVSPQAITAAEMTQILSALNGDKLSFCILMVKKTMLLAVKN